MKDFPTQSQYLASIGLPTKGDDPVIGRAKKNYRKRYLQEYRKRKKQQNIRLTLRIDKERYKKLKNHKKVYRKISLNTFILNTSLAYLNKDYLPRNQEQLEKQTKELNRIGSNINQIVHKLHQQIKYKSTYGVWDDSLKNMAKILVGYELLTEKVEELRQTMITYLNSPPPTIMNLSWEEIRDDKLKLKQLIQFLLQHLEKLQEN